jgi:indole-3-glycerol phosphate synthase
MGLLSDMADGSRQRLHAAQAIFDEAALRERCAVLPPPPRLDLPVRGFDLIAELKLRSPALGDLSARTLDPVARLCDYATAGAAVCSILTEPSRFDGDLAHLRQAADVLAPLGVPAMRKDFLVDPYQVLVPRATLVAMLDEAAALGLFVLLEAFDADDLALARELARERRGHDEQVLMGLNCRDLQTLQIDFARFAQLRDGLPPEWPAVAESGVTTPDDAAQVAALGYRLALVGTALMQREDPAQAVRALLAAGRGALR